MENKPITFNDLTGTEKDIVILFRRLPPEAADQIVQQVNKQTTEQ